MLKKLKIGDTFIITNEYIVINSKYFVQLFIKGELNPIIKDSKLLQPYTKKSCEILSGDYILKGTVTRKNTYELCDTIVENQLQLVNSCCKAYIDLLLKHNNINELPKHYRYIDHEGYVVGMELIAT